MKTGSDSSHRERPGRDHARVETRVAPVSPFHFRGILFGAVLFALAAGTIIGAMDMYFTHGLWYTGSATFRSWFILAVLGLTGLQLVRVVASKLTRARMPALAAEGMLLFGLVYLAFRFIGYSSVIWSVFQNPNYAKIAYWGSSVATGVAVYLVIRRIAPPLASAARRMFPVTVLFALVILVTPYFLRTDAARNVVLVTIDTLRADHLGCYGYERDTSPNTDAFARRSFLFTDPIVQWPKTSPSFSSILTSLYCGQTGVTGTRQKLPRGMTTTAELLMNAGYTTAAVLGNGNLAREYNFDQGFDVFIEAWRDEEVEKERRCDARHITDHAMRLLPDLGRTGGFFLWLHYVDPHAKYTPPEPFHEMFVNDAYYGEQAITLNQGFNEDIGGAPGRSILEGQDNLHYYVAQYDAEIRYCDSELSKVFLYLAENGLLENTMVIISSDHGESLGDHNYYFEHGKFTYDSCLRVPLIVYVPGEEPAVISTPVALLDVHPTILDFAGLDENDPPMEGTSLLELIRREEGNGNGLVYSQSGSPNDPVWSVRDNRWKLIYAQSPRYRNVMTGSLYEFYDLWSDPAETVNIYDLEHPRVPELVEELHRWIETQPVREGSYGTTFDVTDELTRENLKALGYIE